MSIDPDESLALAASGRPFTDPVAAEWTRCALERELGRLFSVVTVDGGYVVQARDVSASAGSEPAAALGPTVATRSGCELDALAPALPGEGSLGTDAAGEASSVHDHRLVTPARALAVPAERDGVVRRWARQPQVGRNLRERRFDKPFHPAWRSQLLPLLALCFGFLLSLSPPTILRVVLPAEFVADLARWPVLFTALFYAGLGLILYGLLNAWGVVYSNTYLVGPRSIKHRRGIFTRNPVSVDIEGLKIEVKQGPVDLLLGIGDVELSAYGTNDVDIVFKGVADPIAIKQEIEQLKDELWFAEE